MCGICGMLDLRGSATPDREVLRAMNDALVHRGPDSAGEFVDGPMAMAMRRLSIIDLAGGDQPISNEDGRIQVIQNGEIYNFRELADELRRRGHELRTRSDTEVIAHLYEEHGLGFAEHLRGMFAIAVWDAERRRLVVARDRYGIKPLYYRHRDGMLSFASELKSLLRQPGFSREIDLGALEAYLAMNFVPTPLTIFRDARKLPPGHLLICEDGEVKTRPYASPRPASRDELLRESGEELAEELRERLRGSVRAHLVADVPVGVLLSGGIDSGTLTALAAAETSAPVKTFTIGFKEQDFSEADLARLVARRFGAEHHELIVEPEAIDLLPKVVEVFDEPFADNSALPTYLVSELAAQHVKVVLSGEGGDELFGGYYAYVGDLWAPRVGRIATALRAVVDRLPSGSSSRRLDDRLKRFTRGAHLSQPERHASWSQVFSPEARERLLVEREGGGFDPLAGHRERWAASEGAEELSRAQDVDFGVYLVDDILAKIDRASMAHSLESRVPFLDPEITDFALALPAKHKVRLLTKKRLFRQAVAPLLPKEILSGRKRGFALPVAAWFRGELLPFARDVLSPERVRAQGLLDPAAVSAAIDLHVSGREDLSRNIWGLICLSLWHDRYVAGGS
jgi:asparagine synthase (glutamine-hydrolysing)